MSKLNRIIAFGALFCGSFGLLFVSGCVTTSPTSSATGERIAIKVSLHGWYDLAAELENFSDRSIRLPASNLPWEWRYSMWVKAYEDDAGGSPLDERLIPADPPINMPMETLAPGKPVNGRIDLRSRFPELEKVLRRQDVIVFWSYVPEPEDSKKHPRLSGSLVIPKFR